MFGPFIFLGLLFIAVALYCGLIAIATAITKLRISQVDVRLPDPINVEHR